MLRRLSLSFRLSSKRNEPNTHHSSQSYEALPQPPSALPSSLPSTEPGSLPSSAAPTRRRLLKKKRPKGDGVSGQPSLPTIHLDDDETVFPSQPPAPSFVFPKRVPPPQVTDELILPTAPSPISHEHENFHGIPINSHGVPLPPLGVIVEQDERSVRSAFAGSLSARSTIMGGFRPGSVRTEHDLLTRPSAPSPPGSFRSEEESRPLSISSIGAKNILRDSSTPHSSRLTGETLLPEDDGQSPESEVKSARGGSPLQEDERDSEERIHPAVRHSPRPSMNPSPGPSIEDSTRHSLDRSIPPSNEIPPRRSLDGYSPFPSINRSPRLSLDNPRPQPSRPLRPHPFLEGLAAEQRGVSRKPVPMEEVVRENQRVRQEGEGDRESVAVEQEKYPEESKIVTAEEDTKTSPHDEHDKDLEHNQDTDVSERAQEQAGEYAQEQEREHAQEQEGEYVQEHEGEYAQEHEGEYVQEHEGQYVQEQEGQYVQEQEGQYVQEQEGQYVQEQERQYVQEQERQYVQEEEGQYVQEEEGQYVQEQEGQYVQEQEGQYVPEQEGQNVQEQEGQHAQEQEGQHAQEQEGQHAQEQKGEYAQEQEGEYTQNQKRDQSQVEGEDPMHNDRHEGNNADAEDLERIPDAATQNEHSLKDAQPSPHPNTQDSLIPNELSDPSVVETSSRHIHAPSPSPLPSSSPVEAAAAKLTTPTSFSAPSSASSQSQAFPHPSLPFHRPMTPPPEPYPYLFPPPLPPTPPFNVPSYSTVIPESSAPNSVRRLISPTPTRDVRSPRPTPLSFLLGRSNSLGRRNVLRKARPSNAPQFHMVSSLPTPTAAFPTPLHTPLATPASYPPMFRAAVHNPGFTESPRTPGFEEYAVETWEAERPERDHDEDLEAKSWHGGTEVERDGNELMGGSQPELAHNTGVGPSEPYEGRSRWNAPLTQHLGDHSPSTRAAKDEETVLPPLSTNWLVRKLSKRRNKT